MKQVDQKRIDPQQQPQGDTDLSGRRQPNQSPPDSGRVRIQRVSAPIDTASVEVDKVLPEWTRHSDAARTLFPNHSPRASGRSDFDEVKAKRTRATTGRIIAYCSYENPWAKSGGINDIVRDGEEAATGILFRARDDDLNSYADDLPTNERKRRKLEQEHRKIQNQMQPAHRMQSWLYSQQVASLTDALMEACAIYRGRRKQYGRILANLPEMAEKISWDIPVRDYRRWYDKACEDTSD